MKISRREFMGIALEKWKINNENIKTMAFQLGYEQAKNEWYGRGLHDGNIKGYERGVLEGIKLT